MLYTIYLNFKNRISEYTLPSGENLRYDIDISSETDTERCTVSFENIDGVWSVVSGRSAMTDNGENRILSGGDKINMHVRSSSQKFVILVSEQSTDSRKYIKYLLPQSVTIGSGNDCSIVIPGELISGKHAVISRSDGVCHITDYSKNGIYINGEKAPKKTVLRNFDSVYFFGTKIIFLGDVLAVNNSDMVSSSLSVVSEYAKVLKKTVQHENNFKASLQCESSCDTEKCVLVLEKDNNKAYHNTGMSDILKTTFITSALMTCAVSFSQKSNISAAAFFALFAAGSGAFLSAAELIKRSVQKRRTEDAGRRRITEYTVMKRKELEELAEKTRIRLEAENRSFYQLSESSCDTLCRRSSDDSNFLSVMAGNGDISFSSYIDLRSDDKQLKELSDYFSILRSVPVSFDLRKYRRVMLAGDEKSAAGMASVLLCGIAGENRPDSLKIFIFLRRQDAGRLGWTRWLPHVFSSDGTQRYVSFDENTQNDNLFLLTSELQSRAESGSEKDDKHIAVFFSSERIFENEAVKKYIYSGEIQDVSFISCGNSQELRRISDLVIEGTGEENTYSVTGNEKGKTVIKADVPSPYECDLFAGKLLGNIYSEEISAGVPDHVSLFDVLGIKDISTGDILKNYKMNHTSEGISAAIATGKRSEPFIIDLHEKKHGPHGLVAGMTGSGKSEVLQTLIVSLALRYSPQELAFILVDYKGGGMSDAFEDLPHTAGIITNLTASENDSAGQSRRVLISLRSEIKKRQQIFRKYHVNHIDMYSRLRLSGNAGEPLPHIVIIVDEFAELRREQPDFISQLISISRIGRSLGMHLILATQKPSGVVDDEIWSNSRFRICLRVQDRNDSIGMLRRTDAAELTAAGRAYVQIGNNEIFEMVQTGYSGELYDPEKEMSGRAYMINSDGTGSVIRPADNTGEKISQLKKTVGSIIAACRYEGIVNACRLWNPPLDTHISIPKDYPLSSENGLVCAAGIADDPENQRSFPVIFDLVSDFNLLVAGKPGSGKTNLVKVLLSSLVSAYDSSVFRFIVFDFSGGEYSKFCSVPHCEKYCEDAEGSELRMFFADMKDEIRKRRQIFSAAGVSGFAQYRENHKNIPAVMVVFEGYYIFRELYPEKEDDFLSLTRDSARYGIFFISTVRQLCDMKFRIRYNFRNYIVFALDDITEYQLAFGKKPGFETASVPGRGFFKSEDILEFQAFCFEDRNLCFRAAENSMSESADDDGISEKYKEKLCCTVKDIYSESTVSFLTRMCSEGSEVLWWTDSCDSGLVPAGDAFYGTAGAEEMLKKLRDIFSVRRDIKKLKGKENFETVFAVIDRLDDFCRCTDQRRDLSGAAEVFFKGGSGYGVCFISTTCQNDTMKEKNIYRYFVSHDTGE